MGVVGSLNPSALLCAQTSEPQSSWPPPCLAHSYYPEYRELLGPVKMCIEERPGLVATSEYGPDRKLLRSRMELDGEIDSDSLDDSSSETYDAEGRILSNRWTNGDGTFGETFYHYDQEGRQTAITNNQNSNRTEYLYDGDCLKMSINTFDPKTIESTRNSGFMGSAFDAAKHGFGVPLGGRVITTYDGRDNPIDLRILTADGQIAGQWVRKWDATGRLEEEKTLQQNNGLLFFDRMTPQQKPAFTPEQAQASAQEFKEAMRGKLPPRTRYKYDAQGRLIEKQERDMIFEHTTTIDYNDHGDIEERRETYTDKSVNAEGNRLPEDMDTRYSYQYDSYNWTERVVTCESGATESRSWTSTTRRTITYY
jgi:hypothetical protein